MGPYDPDVAEVAGAFESIRLYREFRTGPGSLRQTWRFCERFR